ncbi:hypothetical protein Aperf_G00000011060 [Anoplocephala perfoliata]
MPLRVILLCSFCLYTLSVPPTIIKRVKVNYTVTLEPCSRPQVEGAVSWEWVWHLNNQKITPFFSERLKLHKNSGSLTVNASMVDINHLYGCQVIATLPNGTQIPGELQSYFISPITPAFLEHELHNSTIAWGEEYKIRCKAGGVESSLEIKVNDRVWELKHMKIFNNTLIECRAFNSFGEEKASAYLTVLPRSKERASLNVSIDQSTCQPFQIPLPCSDILEAEKPETVYPISTARLLGAETISQIVAKSFQHWNTLVPIDAPPDSARLRCLQQAKRLVCLLAFPRCLITEAYIDDFRRFDVDPAKPLMSTREIPLCQQHCFLITSLLCAASFRGSKGDLLPALHNYKSSVADTNSNFPQGEGWRELLELTPNISYLLPENGCAALPRSTRTKSFKVDGPIPRLTYPICWDLNFTSLASSPTSNTLNSSQNSKSMFSFDSAWIATLAVVSIITELDYMRSNLTFDPLTFLSPSILPPEALNPLPANHSVCRNPLGLAAKPFCVGLNTSTSRLEIFDCPLLVDCADVNSNNLAANHAALLKRQQHMKMISITIAISVFFIMLMCLLFVYILRACRREKVRVSAEEARENRRARLVARRVRLRRAGCCGRCLLHFIFNIQDSCNAETSCCGGRRRGRKYANKIDGNMALDLDKCDPDDEDEEVHHFRAYLNQDHRSDRSVVGLTQMDNQPHLMSFDSENGEKGETVEGPFSTLGSRRSSLQPQSLGPGGNSSSLEVFDEEQNRNVRLDSAFMLVSAGQLIHPKLKQISYSRKLLIEERTLAKSAFGHVILARAPNFPLRERLTGSDPLGEGNGSEVPYVVVKTLNFGATPAAETSFFREAELLIELDHPNIVKIIGICIPLQPYSLIYEYMLDGDLNGFLHRARESIIGPNVLATLGDLAISVNDEKEDEFSGENVVSEICKCGSLSIEDLLRFAFDVCEAMVYLSSRLYVHRDLATRNCLVSRGHVKIADFSMARRLTHGDVNGDLVDVDSEAPLAVRWLPLESILEGRFNFDTDVWSFGIFLWELFTLGRLPYGNVEVSEVIRALTEERRLPRPENCPRVVYSMMRTCWASTREARPTFRQIRTTLIPLLHHFED